MNAAVRLSPEQLTAPVRALNLLAQPKHPNLLKLQRLADRITKVFDRFLELDLDSIPLEFGPDGLQLAGDGEDWLVALEALRASTMLLEGTWFRRFHRDLSRHLPRAAERLHGRWTATRDHVREFRIYLAHMLGEPDAEELGEDLSVPMPDPPPRGPSAALEF